MQGLLGVLKELITFDDKACNQAFWPRIDEALSDDRPYASIVKLPVCLEVRARGGREMQGVGG
jgi:hypothetical protein